METFAYNIAVDNLSAGTIPLQLSLLLPMRNSHHIRTCHLSRGEHSSFYFSEEIFSVSERKKNIRVRDRATLFNLLIGLNGYTVCSGIIDRKLNGKDIIAVPLADESDMRIGYITHRKCMVSRLGNTYLEALSKYMDKEQEKR